MTFSHFPLLQAETSVRDTMSRDRRAEETIAAAAAEDLSLDRQVEVVLKESLQNRVVFVKPVVSFDCSLPPSVPGPRVQEARLTRGTARQFLFAPWATSGSFGPSDCFPLGPSSVPG